MMASKRKSVTFHEDVSMLYPENLDGSSSPVPITTALATAPPSPELDPMYLTWLREATKTQYPFIVNGTFAEHVYRQNFDEHITEKNWKTRSFRYLTKEQALQKQKDRWAATPALAHKYGSLGWGSLYNEVSEEAWVTNYRVSISSLHILSTSFLTLKPHRKSTISTAPTRSSFRKSQTPSPKSVPPLPSKPPT